VPPVTLEWWSWIASIVAGLLAVIGFPAIVWQLNLGRQQRADAVRLSTSQVLLAADGVLAAHADVAAKLRPLGEWHCSTTHPDASEMKLVEPYLGVFERIFIAVSAGQVADEVVDELYGYRLDNIWNNPQIEGYSGMQDVMRNLFHPATCRHKRMACPRKD
jgi:type II secretory pathway pseudopilin PulG